MTRLTEGMIAGIGQNMAAYDRELLQMTGFNMRHIAARAAGMAEDAADLHFKSESAAVVPITAGAGAIEGFPQGVRSILSYLGCPSFVTENSDVSGIAEGIEKGATLVFLADDSRYVAINLRHRIVIDNDRATAWGYAFALDLLAGGLRAREVLLIGAGKVGTQALYALSHLGAGVGVFDIDPTKTQWLAQKFQINIEDNLANALNRYRLLFDASPAPDIIQAEHIAPDTAVAACGIPLGLSGEALAMVHGRLIHDPLELGTATMLAMAVHEASEINKRGADRKDRIDPKSMKPGATPGLPAKRIKGEHNHSLNKYNAE
jgi:pyrrolysine biosynthesis protein PylD